MIVIARSVKDRPIIVGDDIKLSIESIDDELVTLKAQHEESVTVSTSMTTGCIDEISEGVSVELVAVVDDNCWLGIRVNDETIVEITERYQNR